MKKIAILADSAKVKGLTLGYRGSAHRPGWSLRLVRETQKKTFTIEMILCCEGVSNCIESLGCFCSQVKSLKKKEGAEGALFCRKFELHGPTLGLA
jgi:hypothetical protein